MMMRGVLPLISARSVAHAWPGSDAVITLDDFELAPAQRLFLHGPSGCGKSTVLGLLSGVLATQMGDVRILGTSLATLRSRARDRFRAHHIGYIFQQFNLLPFLTPVENVLLGCAWSAERSRRAGATRSLMTAEATRLLRALGLGEAIWTRARTGELSVGQQQRVAAARALIGGPELLLADEPTSALDTSSRDAFLRLLLEECERHGTGVVFVSHDLALAAHFEHSLALGRAAPGMWES
ncbi:MAG TPA: ATP-binding cassette domain-containing protein [Luteibacter sp.]|uniref:ABC transporter ATP-binding protein n=1 Tax=Luteibacter sp. TaxID=1886636 RepID=UPI002F40E9A0